MSWTTLLVHCRFYFITAAFPPKRHSGCVSSYYAHQEAKDCLRAGRQRAWNFWLSPSPRHITHDAPLMSLHPNVHKTQRMFSRVLCKTNHRRFICSTCFPPTPQTDMLISRILNQLWCRGYFWATEVARNTLKGDTFHVSDVLYLDLKSKRQAWTHFLFQ